MSINQSVSGNQTTVNRQWSRNKQMTNFVSKESLAKGQPGIASRYLTIANSQRATAFHVTALGNLARVLDP